jgi:signal peptidase
MGWHRIGTIVQGLVLLMIGSIVVGQFIGQPVLLAYVTSDSMHPVISTGDGYVVLPSIIAGPVEKGDIIVFHAKTLHGGNGALTTHKVVGERSTGYITKGVNNPFTDQSGGEPPVSRHQIVGQAVLIADQPIVIPNLGTVFTGIRSTIKNAQRSLAIALGTRAFLGTQGFAYLLLGAGGVLYVGSVLNEQQSGPNANRAPRRRGRRRRRNLMPRRIPNWMVALALGGILIGSLTITMTVGGGINDVRVVSSDKNLAGPTVIPAGQSEQLNYSVANGGVLPIVAYVDPASDGVETPKSGVFVPPGERQSVMVELTAPPTIGSHRLYIAEHRYIAILPRSWIHELYLVHPLLPVVVIDALVLAAFLIIAIPLLGSGSIRPRSSRSALARRVKRMLR